MGYSNGEKTIAIGLLALTDGDKDRAMEVWERIAFKEVKASLAGDYRGGLGQMMDHILDALEETKPKR